MAVFITVWLLRRIKNKLTLKQKVFGNISVTLFAVLNTGIVVVFTGFWYVLIVSRHFARCSAAFFPFADCVRMTPE